MGHLSNYTHQDFANICHWRRIIVIKSDSLEDKAGRIDFYLEEALQFVFKLPI